MRECGECQACCIDLKIKELDKPNGVPCKHLGEIGCGIYEERPRLCRNFRCAWLQGFLGDDDRPDKSGAVIWQTLIGGRELTTVVCLREGVELQPHVRKWLVEDVGTKIRLEQIGSDGPTYL